MRMGFDPPPDTAFPNGLSNRQVPPAAVVLIKVRLEGMRILLSGDRIAQTIERGC